MHELHGPSQAEPSGELDEHERPTLPELVVPTADAMPVPGRTLARAFDADAERFFAQAAGPEGTEGLEGAAAAHDDDNDNDEDDDDGLAEWWLIQRRKTFTGWVTAIVVACAALFAVGVLSS
jgi:hypothetical protein